VDLQENLQAFRDAGVQVLAVAVFNEDKARRMRDLTGATYPLLADPDHRVTDTYGVYNLLGDGLAAPSVFIIDYDGLIVWSYVGQSSGDRPSAEALLEILSAE